jgi:hypothetical protein
LNLLKSYRLELGSLRPERSCMQYLPRMEGETKDRVTLSNKRVQHRLS